MMHSKLAGHLPLQDMINMALNGTKEKLAASEDKESGKVQKLLEAEKKPAEEAKEKKSSAALDPSDPDQIEKLAAALDELGDGFLKEADEKNIGGESPQGGMVLPTASPNAGKQNYSLGEAKTGKVPMKTPEKKDPSQGKAATQVENNADKPAGTTPYPAKGVLKVSAAIKEAVEKQAGGEGLAATVKKAPVVFEPVGKPTPVKGKAWVPGQGESGGKGKEAAEKCSCADGKMDAACPVHSKTKKSSAVAALEAAVVKMAGGGETSAEGTERAPTTEAGKEKKSEALDFVLKKVAESRQGGLTQDTPSEAGPKAGGPSSGGNSARSNISSIEKAIDMKKVQGKEPQKKMLSTVLTEKAQKKGTDPVLQNNLRNASKAGVKIAAAREFIKKVAADDAHPSHKGLMEALAKKKGKKEEKESEKKSNAMLGYGGGTAPIPSGGTPTPNPL